MKKNIRKKTMKYFLLFAILFLAGCKNSNDDDLQDEKCGCNAEVKRIIPETANVIGSIRFKNQTDPNDHYYNNKFWISYTEANCGNCIHYFIVCNEDFLPQEVLNLKNSGETLSIKFSGELKEVCEKIFAPADYTYENITLTTIQVQ